MSVSLPFLQLHLSSTHQLLYYPALSLAHFLLCLSTRTHSTIVSRHTVISFQTHWPRLLVSPPHHHPIRRWIVKNWFQTKWESTWFNNASAPVNYSKCHRVRAANYRSCQFLRPNKGAQFLGNHCFIRLRIHPPPVPWEAFLDGFLWEDQNGQCYGNLPV